MYRYGCKYVPEAFASQEPAAVPEVLKAWIQSLQGLQQAHRIQRVLVDTINTRAVHAPGTKVASSLALEQTSSVPHCAVLYCIAL